MTCAHIVNRPNIMNNNIIQIKPLFPELVFTIDLLIICTRIEKLIIFF